MFVNAPQRPLVWLAVLACLAGVSVRDVQAQAPPRIGSGSPSAARSVVSSADGEAIAVSTRITPGSIHAVSVGADGHYLEASRQGPDAQRIIIEMRTRPTPMAAASRAPSAMVSERSQLYQVLQRRGGTRVHHDLRRVINGVVATVSADTRAAIARLPYVRRVHDDVRVQVNLNDSVPLIRAPNVWSSYSATGAGVKVAIIDTGIDYTHPDLGGGFGPGHKVVGGYDFVNSDADPMDDYGHGTHVAGIVAANGTLKGVAPDATLLAYKVLDADGFGWTSDIIAGVERAVTDGARVANLSLGGAGSPDDATSQAIDNATAAGMLCVVAAGNSGPGYQTVGSPGVARTALTVGASTNADGMAGFSSRGYVEFNGHYLMKPDMVAPGFAIVSTVPVTGALSSATRYRPLSGTSMATPHVAGAAALLVQLFPARTPLQLKSMLTGSAHDLGFDAFTQGSGRLDVVDAVLSQSAVEPTNLSFDLFIDNTGTVTRQASVRVSNPTPVAQTYQLGTSGALPAGSRIDLDRSVLTLQPGAFADVLVTLTVDTVTTPASPSASSSYSTAVTITGSQSTTRVPVVFLKSATVSFTFSSTPLLVQMYDASAKRAIAFAPTSALCVKPLAAGTYDIAVVFSEKGFEVVTREQVTVAGAVTLTMLASEAGHLVSIVPRDEDGNALVSPTIRNMAVFGRLAQISDPPAIYMLAEGKTQYRFSSVGQGWDAAITAGVACQTGSNGRCNGKFYNYLWTSGSNRPASEVMPAAGAHFNAFVQTHKPPATTHIADWQKWFTIAFRGSSWYAWWKWIVWGGDSYNGTETALTTYVEAGVPDLAAVRFSSQDDISWFQADDPFVWTSSQKGVLSSFARSRDDGSFALQVDPLYDLADPVRQPSYIVPAGQTHALGSSPVSGPLEFLNTGGTIAAYADPATWPNHLSVRFPILTDASYASDRRGRQTLSSPWTFDLFQAQAKIDTFSATQLGYGVAAPPEQYRLAGRTSSLEIAGLPAQLTSTIDFDTRLSDINPPFIGPLQVWDGSAMTDRLSGTGQLRFEARDDNGLGSVSAEYQVGSDWLPLSVAASGTWYTASLPQLGPNAAVAIRVVATDAAGNRTEQVWDPAYYAISSGRVLAVRLAGNGTGRVVSEPAGIDCGSTCSVEFTETTTVTLRATPSGDSIFGGWLGGCTGSSPTCVTTVSGAQTVAARFLSSTLGLTVTRGGTGTGSVTSSPAGIDCGATCSATFARDAVVSLQATAATGSEFTGWGGACRGAGSCTVTLSQDIRVSASFDKVPVPLVTGFSPASASAGWDPFTLTILGENFTAASVVQWNGVAKATTFVDASTLRVSVPASDVTTPGSVRINVTGRGVGVVSASRYYLVDNLAPVARHVDPSCTDANLDGRCDSTSDFKTIRAAIAASGSGDHIVLAAGQYVEAPPLVIDKSISIFGAGAAASVITPGGNTASCTGDGQAWILVPEGVSLSLSYVGFDGTGFDIAQALRVKGAGSAWRWGYYKVAVSNIHSSCPGGGVGLFTSGVIGLEAGHVAVSDVNGTGIQMADASRVRLWYANVSKTAVGVMTDASTPPSVSLSRLVGNTVAGFSTAASSGSIGWNWWGCNAGPGHPGCDEVVGATPPNWIQLSLSSVPGGSSADITASLIYDSTGLNTTPWGRMPDGIVVHFTADQGLIQGTATTLSGQAQVKYYSARAGQATVSATVDNETISNGFTVLDPDLTVTRVSPASGLTIGGTTVTISGTGFESGASVSFGGQPATHVSVLSAVTMTATTPSHAAGVVDMVVANSTGMPATAPAAFTYVTALPVLTWPTPAAITYGTPLSAAQLNAAASVPGSLVYSPPLGTVLNAGVGQTLSVTFTPTDLVNNSVVSTTVTIDVEKASPVVTWATPAAIVYGTALGTTQLNAAANVAGAFAYTPPLGTVLGAGLGQVLSVTFTPSDAANYAAVSRTVTIDVAKATPVITWATPAPIVYGTVLSATQLNASADVPGTFVFTPTAGTILQAGAQTLSATFTPADASNFAVATRTVTLSVTRATPSVTWTNPAPIVYGTALGTAQLNATANVAGTFVYAPAAGTVLPAGNQQSLSVAFTPDDSVNYVSASAGATLDVNPRSVTVTADARTKTYGTADPALTYSVTSGTLVGTDAFTGALTRAPGESVGAYAIGQGTLALGANYTLTFVGANLTVTQATPVITWATPSAIVYGTALGPAQLNATASVAGTFVYAPAAGVTLAAGSSQTLLVTFTPADAVNYAGTSKSVALDVSQRPVTVTADARTKTYGAADPVLTYAVTSGSLVGTDAFAGALTRAPGESVGAYAIGQGTLAVGANYTLTFVGASLTVAQATPVITWATPSAIVYGTALGPAQLNATASVAGTFVYAPAAGTVLGVGRGHVLSGRFAPADPTNYSSVAASVVIDVTFTGPSGGGPATGSVSGNTLTYSGAAYPIVNGKVTFPDCTTYIALGSGLLIFAGPAPGCAPAGGAGSGGGSGSGSGSSSSSSGGGSSSGSSGSSSSGGSGGSSGSGSGAFAGPQSGGGTTGAVSGANLIYNGVVYPITGGRVYFPDCFNWMVGPGGILFVPQPTAGCTSSGSSSSGSSSGSSSSGSSSGSSSSSSSSGSGSSSSSGSGSSSSSGSGSSSSSGGASSSGSGAFVGPQSGGGTTGTVSGTTLIYNGVAYPITGGRVYFPDCFNWMVGPGGILFVPQPTAGCTSSGGASSGSSSGSTSGSGSGSSSSSSGGSGSSSSGGFLGPRSGGPQNGSVSGTTLTYSGSTYTIVNGKVTFPDCTRYIALNSGILIYAGPAEDCTPSDRFRIPRPAP